METIALKYPEVKNYIDGEFIPNGKNSLEVLSSLSGKIISTVPLSSKSDLEEAVKAAQNAFPAWSAMPIKERIQIFYRYKALLEKNLNQLATIVHEENGKTIEEATAEVEKSIELTSLHAPYRN
ncbi:MAG: aldehyde dehydrogenase family protein [Bacteroidia bacterium]